MTPFPLQAGDPAPMFSTRTASNPTYQFDTTAGHYHVLCFFGSSTQPHAQRALEAINGPLRPLFDDKKLSFFGVTVDPNDEMPERLPTMLPGLRYFFDSEARTVSTLYGVFQPDAAGGPARYAPRTFVLDPQLRIIAVFLMDDPAHAERLGNLLQRLPPVDEHAGVPLHAPVLIIPRLFEPDFCRELIDMYEREGGTESGFMRDKDGVTVGVLDASFKRRKDFVFETQPEYAAIREKIRLRLVHRLAPEIRKAFQYEVERIERYVIACYEGEDAGFFRRHRDNTTKATAHRRFACTINLNAHEYEGGDLRFPEFGTRRYRAPTGGAVVFSCSLLHEATPVTRGTRYAFLPFFYSHADAATRDENAQFLQAGFNGV